MQLKANPVKLTNSFKIHQYLENLLGVFKYYISAFLRILNPPPPLHQRNQRGSRPPTPLYFADVILEHIVRVLILFRRLFLKIFSEITNSFRNNKSSTSLKTYLINLIVNLASKFDDHN